MHCHSYLLHDRIYIQSPTQLLISTSSSRCFSIEYLYNASFERSLSLCCQFSQGSKFIALWLTLVRTSMFSSSLCVCVGVCNGSQSNISILLYAYRVILYPGFSASFSL